jgi:multicomponent Na+:H+ antiporter subunit E
MRSLGYVLGLAFIWVLLWGSASPANVLSGLAAGTLLVIAVPGLRPTGPGHYRFRPVAVARLVLYMLGVIVRSNIELAREVVSRTSSLRTAVVGVPLPACSDEILTLITNLVAISPGTMPIEPRQDPYVLYVHVLHLRDVESFRREILHLTDLVVRAFGSDETIADQEAYMRAHQQP